MVSVAILPPPVFYPRTLRRLQKPLDVTEPEERFEERWLNVLAVLLQAAFYNKALENQNSGHDGPHPTVGDGQLAAENRWARVIEEFEAQSSRYDTPHSLVRAHYGGAIMRSQGMLPLWMTDSPVHEDRIGGLIDSVLYLANKSGSADIFYLLAVVLSAAYGGMHMAAWNGTFPTEFELRAWRLCCFLLASVPAIAYFLVLVLRYSPIFAPRRETQPSWRLVNRFLSMFFYPFLYALYYLLRSCYWCARVFIVVESFVSLRLVPIGVYWTPIWPQMIPHV